MILSWDINSSAPDRRMNGMEENRVYAQGHLTNKLSQKPWRDISRLLVMCKDCLKRFFLSARRILCVTDLLAEDFSTRDYREWNLHFRNCWLDVTFQQLLSELFAHPKMLGDLLSSKTCNNIRSENVRDVFSLFANLLGDLLVKKSLAFWQRRIWKS